MECARVLYVVDDIETYRLLDCLVKQTNPILVASNSVEEALHKNSQTLFDICLVDIFGNGMDGLEVCMQLRPHFAKPILMLEYEGSEPRALQAYRVGVDEYVYKPIGLQLIIAKAIAWFQRTKKLSANSQDRLKVSKLRVDPESHRLVRADGSSTRLTKLEYRLLSLLLSHQGQVLDKGHILRYVWGHNGDNDVNLVKNVVYRLRQKIEPNPRQPRHIQTLPGQGYLFQDS